MVIEEIIVDEAVKLESVPGQPEDVESRRARAVEVRKSRQRPRAEDFEDLWRHVDKLS